MATLTRSTPTEIAEEATATVQWMRLARAGAIVMVTWSIILQVLAGLIPPVAVIGAVFLGFVPFLSGERRKLALVYAVLASLAIGGNLPPVIDELSNPESSPAFILTLLSLVGVTLAIVSGLGAFFRWSPSPIRRLGSAAAVVFVVGSVVSLAIGAATESDAALPGDTEVVAEGVMWMPEELTVSESAGLWIDNRDGIRHTFTITELGIDVEVPALRSRRIDIDAAPGTYQIVCEVPGHESMTGTLFVEG
ncbi:MAG: cupredoxin domain-containing protein [Acidimicrobiia bacterium]|nr:cupredoxin domain-containing protein [Acidimicrobiia bacterium]